MTTKNRVDQGQFLSARLGKKGFRIGSLQALIATTLISAPLVASGGTWQTLKNPPPIPEIIDPSGTDFGPGGAVAPLLLTDGGVLIQNAGPFGEDAKIFKLTPDINGS